MSTLNVLLIEDCDDDVLIFKKYLATDSRFKFHNATSLRQAKTFKDQAIDIVVLDLNLPDSSGIETFKRVQGMFPKPAIVILSGQDDQSLAIKAVSSGAEDYVSKNGLNPSILSRSLLYANERNRRAIAETRNLEITRELAYAQKIQQHLIPENPPASHGFDLAGRCQSTDACGGDFYDYIFTKNENSENPYDRIDVVLGDVSGHGFASALVMAGARRIVRTCVLMHRDLGSILTTANSALIEDTLDRQFVTMLFVRFQLLSRRMQVSAGGHPLWILRNDGRVEQIRTQRPPLGILPDITYHLDCDLQLYPGDIVALLTDGVWESGVETGNMFGDKRVFDIIFKNRHKPCAEIIDTLFEEVNNHQSGVKLADDVTTVLVKINE